MISGQKGSQDLPIAICNGSLNSDLPELSRNDLQELPYTKLQGLTFTNLVPAQPDALKFLFLAVQAAGYTVHAKFVRCHTNGTARRGARAFCVACRRRMCYADQKSDAIVAVMWGMFDYSPNQ